MNSPQPEQRADVGEIARRHAPILDQVHDAVIVTDLDGVIHGWNRAAERIYGWSVSEAIGRHVELLYFDEDLHQVIDDVLGPLQLAGSHEIVLRSRHKTGREIFIELRLSLLRDEQDRPIGAIGCSNEITEQKRMVEALRLARKSAEESLSVLTTLYRTAPVGLAFVDCDLRYVRVNEALAEINGVPAAEHIGRPVADLVPKLFPRLEPVYRRVMETRTPVVGLAVRGETSARPGELRHWRANYYPVEAADGTMLGVGVVVVEITETETAREELRRERDLSEKLIQLAQSIVLVLDAEGRIVRYNPFMEKLTGVRLDEAREKDWFRTFLPERDRERIRKLFHQVIGGAESQGTTNPIVTRDGSERQISWWNSRLANATGNVQGLLCIGHDITDLLEAQERTLRSQRLATIGETIAMIAHESRSELDALGLGFQLLSETPANDPDQARWIEMLQRSHHRLQHLFDDLRDFAAPFHPDLALCDLPTLWRAAWESLASKRNGRDAVLAEQVQGDARCEVDALRIEQAFRNLFENSLEACPDPLRIDVRCAEAEQEGRRVVHVFVRDNGPGVRDEDRERLFDPFFTTRQKGSGLGLAIVRRIVEAHGGSIAARDPGQCGAEFVITLPREAGDPPER